MKIFKQPFFLTGVGAIIIAIAIAIVSSALNPSVQVVDKLEKGLNANDSKKIAECFMTEVEDEFLMDGISYYAELLGVEGKLEYEFLISKPHDTSEQDVQNVDCLFVIKVKDKVVYVEEADFNITTKGNKQYIVTDYIE